MSTELSLAWIRMAILHICSRQYREARLRAVTLKPRLLMLLGFLADLQGTPAQQDILLDYPLTHEVLACGTRVTRDEAGRAARALERHGYFQTRPRYRIFIPDRQRLNQYQLDDTEEA